MYINICTFLQTNEIGRTVLSKSCLTRLIVRFLENHWLQRDSARGRSFTGKFPVAIKGGSGTFSPCNNVPTSSRLVVFLYHLVRVVSFMLESHPCCFDKVMTIQDPTSHHVFKKVFVSSVMYTQYVLWALSLNG